LVAKLDREEAISILKGMISTPSGDTVNSVIIVPPNDANNSLSVGYQIHIKGSSSFHIIKNLEARVKQYGLAIKEEEETIIIYKPKKS
jgi:hypothetical protein